MLEGFIPSVKRVLPIVLVWCAFFLFASQAFAQAFPPGSPPDPFTPSGPGITRNPYDLTPTPTNPSPSNPSPGNGSGTGIDSSTATEETVQTAAQPVIQTGYFADKTWYQVLFEWVVSGFGWLVAQVGHFLDYSINKFILEFGRIYNEEGLGVSIDALWGTIRDIFNLTFIFGLVYIGFQIILGTNDSQAKRTIPLLILAALLVNFSLFITKFVVDFSNIAATQIFNLFDTAREGGTASLSIAVTELVGISSVFNYNPNDGWGSGSLVYLFGMMLILLILAYVFLAGAIMITIRFVVLNIYMVFSPVMFLGWVFPGLASYSKQFWKGFLGQAFFAPAFLFMLYLSFSVLYAYNDDVSKHFDDVFGNSITVTTNADGSQGASVSTGALGQGGSMIPFFALTAIFFIASIVVAKKIGFTGGDMVISAAQKVHNKAQGVVTGAATGLVGVGAGAAGYGAAKYIDKAANSQNGAARFAGRLATFSGIRDKAEKAAKSSPQAQWKESRKKRDGEMANRAAGAELSRNIKAGLTAAPGSPEQINFERAIQNSNQEQIVKALGNQTAGSDGYNRVVRAMSHAQVKGLLDAKDDVFGPAQKKDLRSSYASQTQERITTGAGGTNLSDAVNRASTDDLAALGMPILAANAHSISAARMDELKSKLTSTEWKNLNDKRTQDLDAMFQSNPRDVFAGKKDDEIARLPKTILKDPRATQFLKQRVLEIILRENYLEDRDRAVIRTNITTMQGPTGPLTNYLNSPMGQGF